MNIRKHVFRASVASTLALSLCSISIARASAANVVFFPNADISTTPYVISLDGGAATFTFSDINDAADTFIDAVATSGNAMVDSFVGFPAPFQQDVLVSDADSFSEFSSPAGILFSNGLVSIGLEFQLPDGVHFGYATLFGPEVVQYGYNATPGAPIGTGATVPEPATWVMLTLGVGALGALARVRNSASGVSASLFS
jgi:PEP-CTERM motif